MKNQTNLKLVIFIILAFIGTLNTMAQKIAGKIVDTTLTPIASATIVLQTVDSTFVEAVVSKEDGTFSFSKNTGTWSERRFGFPNPAPKMKSIDGAVLTPHGAAHPVAAGNSPAFLYQGMMRYNPKK